MNKYRYVSVICLLMTIVAATPTPLANNNVAEFLRKAQLTIPSKESVVVKRRIFDNNDNIEGQINQISLRSLIGDLEESIFSSALNAHKNLTDKDVTMSENKDNNDLEHSSLQKEELNTMSLTNASIANSSMTDRAIVRTTYKESQSNGIHTHVVIDRIAIQPHTGGIALIPIHDVKHTKKNEDENNDHEITKITISKTEITKLVTTTPESSVSSPVITSNTTTSTTNSNENSTTVEVPSETATTPTKIEQLKEAEQELKEKVAEIEAEPIILSARV